jgi:antitoxin VapB
MQPRIDGMPPYIKDDTIAQLVAELAKQCGVTKQAAVRLAVAAELDRAAKAVVPSREGLATWRAQLPMPPATGDQADNAFLMICPEICNVDASAMIAMIAV